MSIDIADRASLSVLYAELHSALISVVALHRLISLHPEVGPRSTHLAAAVYAESELERFGYQPPREPSDVK